MIAERKLSLKLETAASQGSVEWSVPGHFRPNLRASPAARCLFFLKSDLPTARQRNDANGMDRPRSRPQRLAECVGGLSGAGGHTAVPLTSAMNSRRPIRQMDIQPPLLVGPA